MAITNLPYSDEKIIAGTRALDAKVEGVRDITVDFSSDNTSDKTTATITATFSWTMTATAAADILDQARNHAPDTSA